MAYETPSTKVQLANIERGMSAMESEFLKLLPPEVPVGRFCRIVLNAVQRNPILLDVNRKSLFFAALDAAEDGLLPDGTEGAVVPYAGTAKWLPMVTGFFKRAYNSGMISTWESHCVYERDHFRFALGLTPRLEHEPAMFADPGELIAVYSRVRMRDGGVVFEVMRRSEIEKRRAVSKAKRDDSPWNSWYDEMARKTVVKHHGKSLPLSADVRLMFARDDERWGLELPGQPRLLSYQPVRNVVDLESKLDAAFVPDAAEPAEKPKRKSRKGVHVDATRTDPAYVSGHTAGRKGGTMVVPPPYDDDPPSRAQYEAGWKAGEAERKQS